MDVVIIVTFCRGQDRDRRRRLRDKSRWSRKPIDERLRSFRRFARPLKEANRVTTRHFRLSRILYVLRHPPTASPRQRPLLGKAVQLKFFTRHDLLVTTMSSANGEEIFRVSSPSDPITRSPRGNSRFTRTSLSAAPS